MILAPMPPAPLPAAPLPAVKAELRLTAERTRVAPGKDPGFKLTLVNRGRTALNLVELQDGSDFGWRNPSVAWVLPDLKNPSFAGRCGNTNPTEERMFFRVAPGESREIALEWVRSPELVAGSNRVSFTYETDPKKAIRGFDGAMIVGAKPADVAAAEARIERANAALTPLKLASNVVTITVAPSP